MRSFLMSLIALLLIAMPVMAQDETATPTPAATSSVPDAQKAFEAAKEAQSAGNLDEALVSFQKATELDPKFAQAFGGLALVLAETRKFDQAINAGRTAIKLEPKNAQLHYNLAVVFLKKNDPNSAIGEIKETIKLAPNEPGPWYTLASVYEEKRDRRRAIEGYRNYVRLAPNGDLAAEAMRRINLLRSQEEFEENQRRTR